MSNEFITMYYKDHGKMRPRRSSSKLKKYVKTIDSAVKGAIEGAGPRAPSAEDDVPGQEMGGGRPEDSNIAMVGADDDLAGIVINDTKAYVIGSSFGKKTTASTVDPKLLRLFPKSRTHGKFTRGSGEDEYNDIWNGVDEDLEEDVPAEEHKSGAGDDSARAPERGEKPLSILGMLQGEDAVLAHGVRKGVSPSTQEQSNHFPAADSANDDVSGVETPPRPPEVELPKEPAPFHLGNAEFSIVGFVE